ncbi:uncharacterized protein EHS24_007915 [Apiotrichum porosum]|uniref:Uncharacterized protein n=1 Tax=Apiotrichum porosum TaxID=105984 RepID=A0A427XSA3_9TREE|nr:uncharacterized protein EHS24_007915 [Apiotrichum porosum]RSH81724.1 hypothetical protein EHS24_007915 [Apiotrichum porosum]
MSFLSSKSAPGLQGANDIPAPMSDADRNAAPADTHKRIVDFVKEAPAARYATHPLARAHSRYTFDSHATPDGPQAHVAELCRLRPDGGMSCIKVGGSVIAQREVRYQAHMLCHMCGRPELHTDWTDERQMAAQGTELFKSMQSLGESERREATMPEFLY